MSRRSPGPVPAKKRGSLLSIRLLGPPEVVLDRNPLTSQLFKKSLLLLSFLAVESSRPHDRSYMAELLWPDLPEGRARNNLRQLLHHLRTQVDPYPTPEPHLLIDRKTLRFNRESLHFLDLSLLSTPNPPCLLLHDPEFCSRCATRMAEACWQIRGTFLEGVALPDCPEFVDWVTSVRENAQMMFQKMIDSLIRIREREGLMGDAVSLATRLLMLDPLNESAQRRLIKILGKKGDPEAARLQYESFRRLLLTEVGVPPERETQELVRRIRSGSRVEEEPEALPPAPAYPAIKIERRPATVLFVDVFTSRESAEDPDSQDPGLEQILNQGMDRVKQSGGMPIRSHGTSFLAYFGLDGRPEGAARRAVRAALELHQLCRQEKSKIFRGGISSGLLVTGDPSGAPDPTGGLSRIAMSLCMQAGPETLLISRGTVPLLKGQFLLEESRKLRALDLLVEGVRVLGPSERPASELEDESPLFGRDAERSLFSELWEKNGREILILEGEAGIGKSRLTRAFEFHARSRGGLVRRLECFPEYADSPFFPVVRLLREMLGIGDCIGIDEAYERISSFLMTFQMGDEKGQEAILGYFLSLPPHPDRPLPNVSGAVLKELSIDLIFSLMRAQARKAQILLVMDDLHWADPSTRNLLRRMLADSEISRSVLVVLTLRTNERTDWREILSDARILRLSPLSAGDSRLLVRSICSGSPPFSEEVVSRMIGAAEGVPLFLEEITRSFLEVPLPGETSRIPLTIQEVIANQLDQLREDRAILLRGSVLGKVVPMNLFQAISSESAPVLRKLLERAEGVGLIFLRTDASGEFFEFRHTLIRDVAYRFLLKQERTALHRQVADQIVHRFPEMAKMTPEVVALHWEDAGEAGRAVEWYEIAARTCLSRGAFVEAEGYTRKALRLHLERSGSGEGGILEIRLLLFLGNIKVELEGHGSREALEIHQKAFALCQDTIVPPEDLFRTLCSLCVSLVGSANLTAGRAIGESLRGFVEQSGEPSLHFSLLWADGNMSFWEGNFTRSLGSLTACIRLYEQHHDRWLSDFRLRDTVLQATIFRSWTLWFLGRFDDSRKELDWILEQAKSTEQQGLLLSFACGLFRYFRLPDQILGIADILLDSLRKHRTDGWIPAERAFRGWILSLSGDPAGLPMILHGIALSRRSHRVAEVVYLSLLGEAYLARKDPGRATGVADSALRFSERAGTGFYQAELWRLKGEAALLENNISRAEECFMKSLKVGRIQGARALELRAATSLGRLMERLGRFPEGLEVLAPLDDLLSNQDPDLPDVRDGLEARRRLTGRIGA